MPTNCLNVFDHFVWLALKVKYDEKLEKRFNPFNAFGLIP